MALYATDAVVLGARSWGEADKIMTFFTKERGLVRATAFGCRRPRSPLAGAMQMFSELELQLAEGRRLDTVRTATTKRHYKKLGEDLSCMAYGAFVAEFLRGCLADGQPEPAMYARLLEILAAFEQRNPRVTALAAVYQLLEFTGLQLHYERCVHCAKPIEDDAYFAQNEGGALCPACFRDMQAYQERQDRQRSGQSGAAYGAALPFPAGVRQLIVRLRDLDWQDPQQLRIRSADLVAAENIMLAYLPTILGQPLKSLAFIQQVTA